MKRHISDVKKAQLELLKMQMDDIAHARHHREKQTAFLEAMAEQFTKPVVVVHHDFELPDGVDHSAACISCQVNADRRPYNDYCLPSCPVAVAYVAAGSPWPEPEGQIITLSMASAVTATSGTVAFETTATGK